MRTKASVKELNKNERKQTINLWSQEISRGSHKQEVRVLVLKERERTRRHHDFQTENSNRDPAKWQTGGPEKLSKWEHLN